MEIIKAISEKTDLTNKDAAKFLDAFTEVVSEALSSGDEVSLIGFGSFLVKDRAARTTRNFQTGKDIEVPASKTVKFKVGKNLRDAVN